MPCHSAQQRRAGVRCSSRSPLEQAVTIGEKDDFCKHLRRHDCPGRLPGEPFHAAPPVPGIRRLSLGLPPAWAGHSTRSERGTFAAGFLLFAAGFLGRFSRPCDARSRAGSAALGEGRPGVVPAERCYSLLQNHIRHFASRGVHAFLRCPQAGFLLASREPPRIQPFAIPRLDSCAQFPFYCATRRAISSSGCDGRPKCVRSSAPAIRRGEVFRPRRGNLTSLTERMNVANTPPQRPCQWAEYPNCAAAHGVFWICRSPEQRRSVVSAKFCLRSCDVRVREVQPGHRRETLAPESPEAEVA